MATVTDMAGRFKRALVDAAITAINDPVVKVCYGHPGKYQPDDIVSVGRIVARIDPATMTSSRRTRDVELEAEITVSCFRGGDDEQAVGDRVYELLDLIEEHIRTVDTTLGGTVWWCFCTGHESEGSTDPQIVAKGRLLEATATFTGRGRITS